MVSDSRTQLPNAFGQTSVPPWPRGAVVREYQADPDEPPRDEPTGDVEEWPSTAAELDRALREFGFEAVAAYISFHAPLSDGRWGVFLFEGPMRALTERIRRDMCMGPAEASEAAQSMVLPHELCHFRVDLYALQQELTLRQPLYFPYFQKVYLQVVYTSDCWEEALANRACVEFARRVRAPWKDRASQRPRRISRALTGGARGTWADYVYETCKAAPAGYRDFDKSYSSIRAGLGGQIAVAATGHPLPYPQLEWVAHRGHPYGDKICPCYVVKLNGTIATHTRLVLKHRGDVWMIHRYDPDPWPSKPPRAPVRDRREAEPRRWLRLDVQGAVHEEALQEGPEIDQDRDREPLARRIPPASRGIGPSPLPVCMGPRPVRWRVTRRNPAPLRSPGSTGPPAVAP